MTVLSTSEIFNRLWGFTKPDMGETLGKICSLPTSTPLTHRVKIYKPCGKTYHLKPELRPYDNYRSTDAYITYLTRELNQQDDDRVKYRFYRKGMEDEAWDIMAKDWREREPMVYFALALPQEQKTFEVGMTRINTSEVECCTKDVRVVHTKTEVRHRTKCFITVHKTTTTWYRRPNATTHGLDTRFESRRFKIELNYNGIENTCSYAEFKKPEWFNQGESGELPLPTA